MAAVEEDYTSKVLPNSILPFIETSVGIAKKLCAVLLAAGLVFAT